MYTAVVLFSKTSPVSELSVGLRRGNCVLYKRTLYALGRVSGTAFSKGLLHRSGTSNQQNGGENQLKDLRTIHVSYRIESHCQTER